ncbi:malto-oligosyltrehalose synthase [Pusillimonas sp. TS35]|nr:malto-oligosyltrehalose synthase [Pusillimonas sp. TS35]
MNSLRATVRLQLNQAFTFDQARERLGYFDALGISHLYLSPIAQARPGSPHGYDVVDHARINPELGGQEAFMRLAQACRDREMGIVLDIVPNHMATHPDNAWWWDVLKHGRDSAYARWFDIDWEPPSRQLRGKVLAPFLSQPYGRSMAAGQIQLVFDRDIGEYFIRAAGMRFPLAPGSLEDDDTGLAPDLLARRYEATTHDGRRRLRQLLDRQHYLLAWWRCAARYVNWRRFFEIGDLIGVRVEDARVFDAVHALTLRLYAEGLIDGVRVDHVDGMAEPPAYCRALRAALASHQGLRPPGLRNNPPWLVVEKILAWGESLDGSWEIDGTTGYDFMDQASAVLHDPGGERPLADAWSEVSGDARSAAEHVCDARKQLLRRHFVAERSLLLRSIAQVSPSEVEHWSPALAGRMVDGILTTFPVYRSYIDARVAPPGPLREAIQRFQQLTPPLAAKSQEDTMFYRYGRLLSRNEVGADPDMFALSPEAFHALAACRVHESPRGMITTATHDHKRGEDVRARLAVLSEMPARWREAALRWLHWSDPDAAPLEPHRAGERYMLLQTMIGAWPPGLAVGDSVGVRAYVHRLVQWQTKALREAKQNTGWFRPDRWYEQIAEDYLISLVLEQGRHALLREIGEFAQYIAPAGAVNSFSQMVLRMTAPGIPDLYQGTEWWDFSLVDPDNRAAVDFDARAQALVRIDDSLRDLLMDWRSGCIKQALLARLLGLRREVPDVFAGGNYLPLAVTGERRANLIAYARIVEGEAIVVLAPRLCAHAVCGADQPVVPAAFWGDTRIVLPAGMGDAPFEDVLARTWRRAGPQGTLPVTQVLAQLPVAVLRRAE